MAEIKTKEQILLNHFVPDCYNSDFEAKEGLVYWWDEILAAMSSWEHQQTSLLREENKRLREGLEGIANSCDGENPTHETIWRIAIDLLTNDKKKV